MSECIVFNDASLPFPPEVDPSEHLLEFFSILKKANDAQIYLDRANEADCHWGALDYSSTFSFGEWLNNRLNPDERLNIKNVMSKISCPFNPEAKKNLMECAFALKDEDTITTDALGLASIIGAPSLSFSSHDRWRASLLEIIQVKGDESCYLKVKNINTVAQAEPFIDEVCSRRQADTQFFKKLEASGNADFPSILFSRQVLKTLRKPIEVSQYQTQIIGALQKLEAGIQKSKSLEELLETSELEISGESSATMERPRFARKRIFTHPELGDITFQTHVKNFLNARRLYICPDFNKRKVCVGYFGPHLPTVKFPT